MPSLELRAVGRAAVPDGRAAVGRTCGTGVGGRTPLTTPAPAVTRWTWGRTSAEMTCASCSSCVVVRGPRRRPPPPPPFQRRTLPPSRAGRPRIRRPAVVRNPALVGRTSAVPAVGRSGSLHDRVLRPTPVLRGYRPLRIPRLIVVRTAPLSSRVRVLSGVVAGRTQFRPRDRRPAVTRRRRRSPMPVRRALPALWTRSRSARTRTRATAARTTAPAPPATRRPPSVRH